MPESFSLPAKPVCVCVWKVGASRREGKQRAHSVAVDVIRPVSSWDMRSVCSGEELCSPIEKNYSMAHLL